MSERPPPDHTSEQTSDRTSGTDPEHSAEMSEAQTPVSAAESLAASASVDASAAGAPPLGTETGETSAEARKRLHPAHRFGLWSLALMALVALFIGIAVLAFTGRTIVLPDMITSRIETKINSDLDGAKISIGRIVVLVDKTFVPRVTARNVGLIDGSGAEIARLNELRAVLSKDALKQGRLRPDTLRLSGAQVTVRRRADGTFALDFGGAQGTAGSAAEVLEAIDRAFSTEPLSKISRVEAREITVSLEDARSGRLWQATDAAVILLNSDENFDITLNFELFNGTEDLSDVEVSFASQKGSLATVMSLSMDNAPTRDFALQSPALSFLSVVDAPVSAAMRAEFDTKGRLAHYSGKLAIGAGQIVAGEGAKPLAFEGASGYFDYDPTKERIEFPQFSLKTDALNISGRGHILLRDFDGAWPQVFTSQWQLSELKLAPDGVFSEPLVFDQGMADLQLRLAPFRLEIGQLDLKQGDLWLRGTGRAAATPEGWQAGLDLNVDAVTNAELMALWPPKAIAKTRDWMAENIHSATYRDLNAALRFVPGQSAPTLALDWRFDDLDLRYIPAQPPLLGGHGYGSIFGNALTVVLDGGAVTPPRGGAVDMAGTVVRIPNITEKPARLDISLATQSTVEAGLSLVAEKPFSVLNEAAFGPDVAKGQASLRGAISFPLNKIVTFEDVNFLLNGTLSDVSSDQLMRGQVLSADQLALTVDPAGLTLAGSARIGTAQAAGQWRKNFGPDHRGSSDMTGRITLNQALLDTFKIALPDGTVAGDATGSLSVALRKGQPPKFDISSDLSGMRLSFAPLKWGKPAGTRGTFTISGTAGDRPDITNLALSAAGLEATGGRVTLTPEGTLDRLDVDRFKLGGWLDVPASLVGQGAGQPVKVEIRGGRLDLPEATFGGSSGAGTGAAIPIEVQLDRFVITKGQELNAFSARLSLADGVTGSFRGDLNGAGTLTGTVRPGPYGPTITATSKDAGSIVTAAGVLERASGGELSFGLTALPEEGSYDGRVVIQDIRVQSAPALAELLSAVSVVGLIDQMTGAGGIQFSQVQGDFTLRPGRLSIRDGTAEGPSLGITLEGLYDTSAGQVDLQGVVSPVYFINALGQVVARKGEGLFGFTYTLTGDAKSPAVGVNPLSILTPGALRDIFRKKPAGGE
ncbi:YhdP family protein [Celeribacter baekdonensis]|uniref:YhdP central domain-containing protein n=1 Tax=Celeribacter baekdonensis B30 TaxID=1208323 RepID=K2K5V3_9RHOB|nr:AsmA-like C-terminal region-containing protein [Celeribacter baekdonensis]EKE72835.1 hypothetical protein B30_07626 [Celeribacter baekdonensis B30]